jgi:DNA-binding NarL/FixJ family response regulator
MVRASVLCAGRQRELLQSPCEALRQASFHVVSALTLKETGRKFLAGDFDVVVFCHTIPPAEQAATAAVIRHVNPSTKIIALTEREQWREYADDTVLSSHPGALVAACAKLVSQRMSRCSAAGDRRGIAGGQRGVLRGPRWTS